MVNTIKSIVLLFALLGHLGQAFGAISFSSDVANSNEEPCLNHIPSSSDGVNLLELKPCEKHCTSITPLIFSCDSFVAQKLASKTQDKLATQFDSLELSINLPPPK